VRGGRTAVARAGGDGAGALSGLRQIALSFLGEGAKTLLRPIVPSTRRSEIVPEYLAQWSGEDPWRVDGPFGDRLSNALYTATFRTSLPALLRYEDRNSMAFGLEARTPFLDYRVVEYALALPFTERIDGDWTKAVLRRAMDERLPDDVTWRRDKMGYPTPFGVWLRGEFASDAKQMLEDPRLLGRGIFDADEVRGIWQEHASGTADRAWKIWRILALEQWFEAFVDRGLHPPATSAALSAQTPGGDR
jgi:hypothetical protein